ncbi:MAG TPA: multidrug ABC transporter ATP-binding protein [Rhodospirillaceae bacterium]|jgi:ABC-2 type transport system ATP-binding protein|nr:ABC transporter ATP-binding protein [Alphaproteobacteria bacterium]HBH25996.1 multidrug ABC transporter ATP-binding protein [Rhodospirillaceae bacterium]
MTREPAIALSDLRKVYKPSRRHRGGRAQALAGVTLDIPRGSLFALLGPNGAGKSTLINILAGIVRKTSGTAQVWGRDLDADPRGAKLALGVVPQEIYVDPFFTPRQILEIQAGFFGVPRAQRRTDALLDLMDLRDKQHAYTMALSGGMKRRLMVAKAMVHAPPILILDEPTAGVDIALRQRLWEAVRGLNAAGTTIVLTTHYLEEAQALCERVAIIDKGALVACEATEDLLARVQAKSVTVRLDREVEAAPTVPGFTLERTGARSLAARYNPQEAPLGALLEALSRAGYAVVDISTRASELEEVFLQLTGG